MQHKSEPTNDLN